MTPRPVDARLRFGARFEVVFERTYEPLQRYARRRVAAADVDDVVAETLTTVWRRIGDVPDGDEVPWVLGVARRTIANQRRGEQRRHRLTDRAGHQLRADAPDATAVDSDSGLPVDTDIALNDALADLGADDRELIRLWAWEQLAPREIATVMDISANAVSIRLHRARRQLAERLAAHEIRGDRKKALTAGHSAGEHDGKERS